MVFLRKIWYPYANNTLIIKAIIAPRHPLTIPHMMAKTSMCTKYHSYDIFARKHTGLRKQIICQNINPKAVKPNKAGISLNAFRGPPTVPNMPSSEMPRIAIIRTCLHKM